MPSLPLSSRCRSVTLSYTEVYPVSDVLEPAIPGKFSAGLIDMFENKVIVDLNDYGLTNGSNDGLCTYIAAKVANLSDPALCFSFSTPLFLFTCHIDLIPLSQWTCVFNDRLSGENDKVLFQGLNATTLHLPVHIPLYLSHYQSTYIYLYIYLLYLSLYLSTYISLYLSLYTSFINF